MKRNVFVWGMVLVFTIMTAANALATRSNVATQSECYDGVYCPYLAETECQEFCSGYGDYCFDIEFMYGICGENLECNNWFKIRCWNGHWETWNCIFQPDFDCW